MTNVLLYWNHICVLHNQEKAFLARLAESLKAEDIELTVRYFGLGYPEHMSEYLAREDAVLAGIESRTSSPVRICRDESLQANIRGIYPCGEGAGYAGGITSAAMDGIRVAESLVRQ